MNEVWRFVAVSVVSILVALVTSYFSMRGDWANKAWVNRQIEKNAPYVEDRKLVLSSIHSNAEAIALILSRLDKSDKTLAETNIYLKMLLKDYSELHSGNQKEG